MPPFKFDVDIGTTDQNSNAVQAFTQMLETQQRAFKRLAQENSLLQEKINNLQTENNKLHRIIDTLRSGSAPKGMDAEVRSGSNSTFSNKFALERKFQIHEMPVHGVSMGPSHDVVATASWDGTVKLYNLASEEVVTTLAETANGRMAGLYSVAFAKTIPNYLACTSADKAVYLWNYADSVERESKLVAKLCGHSDEVNGIDFHNSQTVMCTASDDCKALIWDFQEGITLRQLDKHTKPVYGCSFLGSENEFLIATCCFDHKTRVFDMRDKLIVAQLEKHTDDVIGIDYSSPKGLLATGSDDGLVAVWDSRTWKPKVFINTRDEEGLGDNEIKRVAFSPDGGYIAAACSSHLVLVYDISEARPRVVARLEGHSDCVFDVTWGVCPHTGAKMLVSASHDMFCQYWRESK